MAERWFKFEVEKMRGALDHFRLGYAQFFPRGEDAEGVLDARREGIVRNDIANMASMHTSRAEAYRKTAEHFRKNPNRIDADGANKFEICAKNADKIALEYLRILSKLDVLGLPDEVKVYDPFARPGGAS